MEVVLPPGLKGALGAALKEASAVVEPQARNSTDKPDGPSAQKSEADLNKNEQGCSEIAHGASGKVSESKFVDAFAIGERVQYWSETHKIWVDSEVEKVSLVEGVVKGYQLTAKSNAAPARVRRAAAATAAAEAAEPAAGPMVAGDMVQYWSETKRCWLEAVIQVVRSEATGAGLLYDLSCKRGVPPARVRLSLSGLRPGMKVEYWSVTVGSWVPTRLLRINGKQGTCDLDVKRGAPLARTRRVIDGTPTIAFNTKGAAASDPNVVSPEFGAGVVSPEFAEAGEAQAETQLAGGAAPREDQAQGLPTAAASSNGLLNGHGLPNGGSQRGRKGAKSRSKRKRGRRKDRTKASSANGPDRRSPGASGIEMKKAKCTQGRSSSSSGRQRRARDGRRSRSVERKNDRSQRREKSIKTGDSPKLAAGGKLAANVNGSERDKPSFSKQSARKKRKRAASSAGSERQRRRSQSTCQRQASRSRSAKRKPGKRKRSSKGRSVEEGRKGVDGGRERSKEPKRVRLVPNSSSRA